MEEKQLTEIAVFTMGILQRMQTFKDWLQDQFKNFLAQVFGDENPALKLQRHEEMLAGLNTIDEIVETKVRAALQGLPQNQNFLRAVAEAQSKGRDEAEERRLADIRGVLAEIRGIESKLVDDKLVQSLYGARVVYQIPHDAYHSAIAAELERREEAMVAVLNSTVTTANRDNEAVRKYAGLLVDEAADPTEDGITAFLKNELADENTAEEAGKLVAQLKKAVAKKIQAE